ncbi:MAG TPA: hypothetical protein VHI93_01840, partial [Candidatus Thermoplasmatota archaeon]|nr:hypothetical protein [Candidatus Thermoplasmatota archaeon]
MKARSFTPIFGAATVVLSLLAIPVQADPDPPASCGPPPGTACASEVHGALAAACPAGDPACPLLASLGCAFVAVDASCARQVVAAMDASCDAAAATAYDCAAHTYTSPSLSIDVDTTPYYGAGCDGHTFFANQSLLYAACDNSINETTGAAGGPDRRTPTWIRIQLPGQSAGNDGHLQNGQFRALARPFPDGKGLLLDDLHVKWPTNQPETRLPDFATLATQYSNLDNDANTDFEEILLCGSSIANPTNPRSDCRDWDGDGHPNGSDSNPLQPAIPTAHAWLEARDANTGAVLTGTLTAPVHAQILYRCSMENGTLSSVSLDLGWEYNNVKNGASAAARSLQVPAGHCDGTVRGLADLPEAAGKPLTYLLFRTETAAGTLQADQNVVPKLTVTPASGTPIVAQNPFRLRGFDAVALSIQKDRASHTPLSFAGSKVSCTLPSLPAGHAPLSGTGGIGLALAVGVDEGNGSPSSFACSEAGTETFFQPTYHNSGTSARSNLDQTFTASFGSIANPVTRYNRFTIAANAVEEGTLQATGCGPCYSDSPAITWVFQPTSLTDEENQ